MPKILFRKSCFILFCGLLIAVSAKAESFISNRIEKCERLYEEGFYRKALAKCDIELRRYQRQGKEIAAAKIMMYKAKYLEALALYSEFDATLNSALSIIERTNKASEYGIALLEAANLYVLYGDLTTAERLFWRAQEKLNISSATGFETLESRLDDYTLYLLYYIEAKINLERGNFQRFYELYEPLKTVSNRRIRRKETFIDISGNKQERTLDAFQFKRRKTQYAQILTMAGYAARLRGDYPEAKKKLNEAQSWIVSDPNLSRFSMAYITNSHQLALLEIESGGDLKKAKKMMEKAVFSAERIVQTVHKDYLNLHEDLIEYYAESRFYRKGNFQRWEFDKNTKMFFGPESPPHFTAKRLTAKLQYYLYPTKNTFERVYRNLIELKNDINSLPLNHFERVKTLELLYNVSISSGKIDEAYIHLNELINAKKVIYSENSLTYHVSLAEKASFITFYRNDLKEARSLFEESYSKFISKVLLPAHPIYRSVSNSLSEYYEINGIYDSARMIISNNLKVAKETFGEEHPLTASVLERQLDLEIEMGEFKTASGDVEKLNQSFKKYDKHHFNYEYSRALGTIARFDAAMGLYSEARSSLNKSNIIASLTPVKAQSNLAIDEEIDLLINTGNFSGAQKIVLKAIEERKARYGENSKFLIRSYGQLGSIYSLSGEFVEAEKNINIAYDLAVKNFGENSLRTAEILRQKAELMSARGDYDNAEEVLNQVIEIQKKIYGTDRVPIAKTYNLMALVELNKGDSIEKVENLMNRSVEIIKKEMGENAPAYAVALKYLAIANTKAKKYDQAKKNLNIARKIWSEKGGNKINVAEIDIYLADVFMREKLYEDALARYKRSAKLYKRTFSKTHPGYIQATGRIARVHYVRKKYGKSNRFSNITLSSYYSQIEKFFPALSDNEKNKFWSLIKPDFEFYNSLAVASRKAKHLRRMYENTISTKSLLLSGTVKLRALIRKDSALSATYDLWTLKKDSLAKSLSYTKEQLMEFNIVPKKLEKDIENLDRKLSSLSSEFAKSKEKMYKYRDIRKGLKRNEVAVEIVRFRHFDDYFTDSICYVALIASKKRRKAPELVVLPNGNFLETKAISYYNKSMEHGLKDNVSYGFFWKRIDEKIDDKAVIYLSTSGVYNQINVETLADGNTYMIDKSRIYLVGNTKDILLPSSDEDDGIEKAALFGCPGYLPGLSREQLLTYDFTQDILQLPATYEEVQTVDSLLQSLHIKTSKQVFYDATEENLRNMKNPDILHIATHGFFIPSEKADLDADQSLEASSLTKSPLMRSGLLLSNSAPLMEGKKVYNFNKEPGILTAYDAMSLELQGTELVVLSACQTAVGEDVGDGVYGLQRSFIVAGAKKLIMSLYTVDDLATRILMVTFFQKWKGQNMPVREAFIEAKRELRQKYPNFRNPKYWGAFIMTGTK